MLWFTPPFQGGQKKQKQSGDDIDLDEIELDFTVRGAGDNVKAALAEALREVKEVRKDDEEIKEALQEDSHDATQSARFAQHKSKKDESDDEKEAKDAIRDERLLPEEVLRKQEGLLDIIDRHTIGTVVHTDAESVAKCLDDEKDACVIMVCSHTATPCLDAVVRMLTPGRRSLSLGTICVSEGGAYVSWVCGHSSIAWPLSAYTGGAFKYK